MHAIALAADEAMFTQAVARAVDDHDPVIVTRPDGEPAIIISLADWNAMQETEYLLSTPANAENLRRSMAQADAGDVVEMP